MRKIYQSIQMAFDSDWRGFRKMELHSENTKQSVYFIFDIQTDAPFDLRSLIHMDEFHPSCFSASGFHFHLNSFFRPKL